MREAMGQRTSRGRENFLDRLVGLPR